MQIKLKEVSFKYKKSKEYALKNINIELSSNVTYIVGENGSGKSTFINLLNGIISPFKGDIYINNENIKNMKALKQIVGVVYQFSDNQIFNTTVENELLYGVKKNNLSVEKSCELIKNYFIKFNLDINLLKSNPYILSGGEKKKIAIISILLLNPKILILDEPTIGLDIKSKQELVSILNDLSKDIMIIVISHNFEEVFRNAKEVLELHNGEVCLFEVNREYFRKKYELGDLDKLPYIYKLSKVLGLKYDENLTKEKVIKDVRRKL